MPLIKINNSDEFNIAKELVKEVLPNKPLSELLYENRLDVGTILSHLCDIIESNDSSAVKLRSIETALKLNGVLNDKTQDNQSFVFNIIIKDNYKENPIIIPREVTNAR